MLCKRRATGDANAQRGVGCWRGGIAIGGQCRKCVIARRRQRIHPQVERGRRYPRAGQRGPLRVAVGGAQAVPQPIGQVVRDRRRQRVVQARLERAQPGLVGGLERGLEVAQRSPLLARQHRERKLARFGRCGERFQRAHPAKQREHAFRDESAVMLAHFRVCAEERTQAVVGRNIESAHALDRGRKRGDLVGADVHSTFPSSTRIEFSRTSTVPRSVLTTRILTGT